MICTKVEDHWFSMLNLNTTFIYPQMYLYVCVQSHSHQTHIGSFMLKYNICSLHMYITG